MRVALAGAALTLLCGHGAARTVAPDMAVTASAPAQGVPHPGSAQYHGDWAVGCDNVLRCQAITLEPKDASETRLLMLEIVRAAGPAGETLLRARSLDPLPPRLVLVIDGRKAATLKAGKDGDPLVGGSVALSAVKAMAAAATVELVTKKGAVLVASSTAGLSESLRFMDTRQGRTGTRSALVARGTEPDSRVPLPPPLPVVAHPPAPDADSAPPLTEAEAVAARQIARCDASLVATTVTELAPLDSENALLLLPCEAGAHNVSAVPLVAHGTVAGARTLSIAHFDFVPGFTGDPAAPPLVVNALWDARRGILSSLAKGRGVGDCGASEDYVWDGTMFRLVERHAMHVCRGAWDWIRLWTASPRTVTPTG